MYKEILSAVAIALTLVAYLPYIRSVLQGTTKPHVFSWVIWGSATFIVFFAQLTDGAGIGAWPLGFSGLVTLYLAFLAYRGTSDTSITRLDWIFFTMAMSSLPLWYLTSDPLAAVVILTVADLLGFGPTIRKAYDYPFEEQVMFFVLMAVRNFVVIAALENYTLTTVLFPAAVGAACFLFVFVVMHRRRVLA